MPAPRRGARPASRSGTRRPPPADSPEAGGRYGEPDAVEVNIEELGQVEEPINVLLFGPPGHGKTRLAAGAPRSTFLTTEKGVVSAKGTGSTSKVIRAINWAHTNSGIKWAEANLVKGDWLIVDSATKMQQMMLTWILETQALQSSKRDVDLPEVQDHQKWQNMYRRFIDRIYDMPCNTITIATSMIREDKNGDDEVIPELMGGERWQQLSHYMGSQAGVVLYYAMSKTRDDEGYPLRYALAQPAPPYMAKDRYSALGSGQYVYDGDFGDMAKWIKLIEDAEAADAAA
jgi:AAA domain